MARGGTPWTVTTPAGMSPDAAAATTTSSHMTDARGGTCVFFRGTARAIREFSNLSRQVARARTPCTAGALRHRSHHRCTSETDRQPNASFSLFHFVLSITFSPISHDKRLCRINLCIYIPTVYSYMVCALCSRFFFRLPHKQSIATSQGRPYKRSD